RQAGEEGQGRGEGRGQGGRQGRSQESAGTGRARVLSRIPHTAPARPRVVEVVRVDPEDGSAEARNVDGPKLLVRLAPEAARTLAVGDRILVRVRHRGRDAWGEVMRKLGRPLAAVLGMVERGGRGLVLRASDKRLREEFLLTKLG